jgi:hypothetical protein
MKQGEKFVFVKDPYDSWRQKYWRLPITTQEDQERVNYRMWVDGILKLEVFSWDIHDGGLKTGETYFFWGGLKKAKRAQRKQDK